jgi:hypothetical protein
MRRRELGIETQPELLARLRGLGKAESFQLDVERSDIDS